MKTLDRHFLKTYLKGFILTALLISFGHIQEAIAQNKHALIIAIGEYPEDSDWPNISSENDVPLIENALIKQGFSQDRIAVLKSKEANKTAILAELKKLAENAGNGDIVVVHISSHGQQIMDDNGDELDGYDEAIVAYGAPASYDPLYKGENHLRDEELGNALGAIRSKIGSSGDVILFVDACHSGTATRGPGKKRGGKAPFAPADFTPSQKSEDIGVFENNPTSRNTGNMAPLVVFSASRSDEINYEYDGYGSLSVAISRSMANLQSGMSYRAFFAKILKEMSVIAPKQNPAIEGDVDREMFGGKVVAQEAYYTIFRIKNERLNLNGGQLNGLFIDTEIEVYPAGTSSRKGKTPLATGTISSAEGTWSFASLDKALDGNAADYWVFVSKQSFGEIKVSLDVRELDELMRRQMEDWAKDFDLVELIDGEADLRINMHVNSRSAAFQHVIDVKDGKSFDLIESFSGARHFDQLTEFITLKVRGEFMKNLELEDPELDVQFEFLVFKKERGAFVLEDTLSLQDISNNGIMEISARNMGVKIKVTNYGSQRAFFNIIDIEPGGAINGILPDPEQNHNPSEFVIEPGQTHVFPYEIDFFPPYGTEVFKLFATNEEIDFSPIITKSATRGEKNEMEKLFSGAFDVQTRGGKASKVSTDMEASTHSVTFKIVK